MINETNAEIRKRRTAKHSRGLALWTEHCREAGGEEHIPRSEGGTATGDTTWGGYAVCRVTGCEWSTEIPAPPTDDPSQEGPTDAD